MRGQRAARERVNERKADSQGPMWSHVASDLVVLVSHLNVMFLSERPPKVAKTLESVLCSPDDEVMIGLTNHRNLWEDSFDTSVCILLPLPTTSYSASPIYPSTAVPPSRSTDESDASPLD